MFLGEKELSEQEIQNLKSEASYFESSELFKIMNLHIRGEIEEVMFDKQEKDTDMIFCKGGLWILEMQRDIMKVFK